MSLSSNGTTQILPVIAKGTTQILPVIAKGTPQILPVIANGTKQILPVIANPPTCHCERSEAISAASIYPKKQCCCEFLKLVAYRNPTPTVDIIIELLDRPHRPIILIERLNEPFGWAIPGGFVDYGESVEAAARRESLEEIGLEVELIEQFHVYSDPNRDPRQHTISVVFIATATGDPQAGDDAKKLEIFESWRIPTNLCFDHDKILRDYWRYRHYGIRPML